MKYNNKNICSGFSLLEVLLAVCIFGSSMLALAYFATTAWRRTYDAHLTNLGVVNAANRVEAEYARDRNIYHNQWQQNLAQILPQGKGGFEHKNDDKEQDNNSVVTVCWRQLFRGNIFCYKLDT